MCREMCERKGLNIKLNFILLETRTETIFYTWDQVNVVKFVYIDRESTYNIERYKNNKMEMEGNCRSQLYRRRRVMFR